MARGFKGFNRRGNDFPPMVVDFAYTGGVQTLVVPHKALYKLEVWGAQGGGGGGNGGYSIGYKVLEKGTTLYICVGGQGGNVSFTAQSPYGWYYVGGYNGGGQVKKTEPHNSGAINARGGVATHIGLVNGTIASIGKTSFVNNGNGLIVAGGGGGYIGGGGGGANGGNGGHNNRGGYTGSGGTQTSGGWNNMASADTNGSFGQGGGAWADNSYSGECGAGGGGLYGGAGGAINSIMEGAGGGGGSGYVGGVPEVTYRGRVYTPIMYGASSGGNGKARITLVK